MKQEFKALQVQDLDQAGKGKALIAVLGDIDNGGDTYAKDAFAWKDGGGQWAMMVPGHDKQHIPFGKTWVYEAGGSALADFTLNLNTDAGKQWHEALKFDLETGRPVQEWSYGYRPLQAHKELRGNRHVRVLDRLDVFEISPVLRGEGSRTGTLQLKSLKEEAFAPLIGGLAELAEAIGEDASRLTATGFKQLSDIHAALGTALAAAGADQQDDAAALAEADRVLARYLEGVAARARRLGGAA